MSAVVVLRVRSSSSEVVVGWLLLSMLVVTLIYRTPEYLITLNVTRMAFGKAPSDVGIEAIDE